MNLWPLHQVDLLPLDGRHKLLARARKRLAATFAHTKFAGCPLVAVAAKPGAAVHAIPSSMIPAKFELGVSTMLIGCKAGPPWPLQMGC